ncbi:DnaJ domain-containing protein [Epilithonimonas ginsengisoli]|uniref:DnaJ domain-containing protein n=1 Tax=Epilithonimonas ginsengisoli TaxID=1245592 RepID=A0ABU4JFB2_9FLAO|nr:MULTISPECIES: DnaJ domain-containing protein [Chryseobacterium group]MBV6879738.1 DnaJ domain-containing protein [Epilithonimonas sp. FP105]MDW8548377.1 DnaJ domain-containing protein [Epilithonimonas ginsengisoli]OAH72608.1 molecular chaperone DnaJ [Chryseobacterium sp. FP211-J200]
MKDYYYFLGIPQNASAEDIKKAYRKLSLKYHPDKNENDDYFSDRFKEVKEAYETLTDPERKRIYDQNLGSQQRNVKSILPPKIKNFSASKIRAQKDEEITIYWNTYDADLVKIVPFGLEKPNGERTIRIKEFDSQGKFQILLHATNTILHKTIVQGITITELAENESNSEQKETLSNPSESFPKAQKKETKSKRLVSLIIFLALAAMIIWLMFN